MRDDAFVEFRQVRKTYDGETLAVADLDLSIGRGEFLTLLGPSGSGKTTALMMLAGFEVPTEGEVRLDGRSLARTPPWHRNMGVVFQNYALFPHLTVSENIAFPLRVRRVSRAAVDRQVGESMALVQLTGLGSRRPSELSGGQQQRVALARALVFSPDVVLMDEPLGALDKQLREQLQMEIKHIQQRLGVTVLYVTHDQSEALTLSDRIAVFNAGRLQQLAKPQELYEQPANAFVAGFVGENNRLDGNIVAVDGACSRVRTKSGMFVRARTVGRGAPGDRAILSIRPERISLHPSDEHDNVFETQIEELIYQGDHTRIRLKLRGGVGLTARTAGAPAASGLAVGNTVAIGWSPMDCLAFTADGMDDGRYEQAA